MKNKKRLIWDEDVQRRLVDLAVKRGSVAIPFNMITNILFNESQTIDAVEVVHGKWGNNPWIFGFECDQCGKWLLPESGDAEMNYCPNCGAKMDGGE